MYACVSHVHLRVKVCIYYVYLKKNNETMKNKAFTNKFKNVYSKISIIK